MHSCFKKVHQHLARALCVFVLIVRVGMYAGANIQEHTCNHHESVKHIQIFVFGWMASHRDGQCVDGDKNIAQKPNILNESAADLAHDLCLCRLGT